MASPAAIANALSAQSQVNATAVVPGVSPLTAGYNQWVAGRAMGAGLPREMADFLAGAFGPLSPIVPMPIDQPQETGRAMPRRWQYPVGWNMPVGQPGTEGLKLASFAALRQYADIYSVVRAMLNIRKNELAGLDWDIGPTPDAQAFTKNDKGAVKEQHERSRQIVRFFKHIDPDYNGFQSWFNAILEEMFVIDAMALYCHPTKVEGKGLFGSSLAHLEALNGATIRPLVDMYGATPRPPAPAYQQYLWGVPRTDLMTVITDEDLEIMAQDIKKEVGDPEAEYRADQLLYLPRTKRTWTPYGFGPIEQALMPITLGLKRQEFLLDFFTEGTIPGVYVIAGDQYVTPAQQRQLQDTLNALAGDQAWKHRVIVLPPNSKTEAQKDLSWQNQVDQTIVEQVAMILHIQPHEIGMVPGGKTSGLGGKGMVQGQQDSLVETRTMPERKWLKETVFDWVVQDIFGQRDLEWKWVDFDEEEDKEAKANAQKADLASGKLSIDEIRIEDGLDPWNTPYTQKPFIVVGPQIVPLDPSVPPIPAQAPPPGSTSGDGTPLPPGHKLHPDGEHMVPPGHTVDPIKGTVTGPDGKEVPPEKLPVAPKGGAGAVGPDGKPLPGQQVPGGPPPGAVDHEGKPVAGTPEHAAAQAAATGPAVTPAAKEKPSVGRGKGKKPPFGRKMTVAELVKGHIKYKGDLTDTVYAYLLRSYPKDVVEWVKGGEWEYDPGVKLSDINMARRPGGRDPKKVGDIADTLDSGASMDPIVLVESPTRNGYKYDIADGWHRVLGAEKAGWDEVPAFIGSGFDDPKDWGLEMQDESDSKKKAAYAELAVLRRYLRRGGKPEEFKTAAIDSDVMRIITDDLYSRKGALDSAIQLGWQWVQKAGGNPEGLRNWYNEGADGQIDWGEPGDFDQCVSVASNYMDEEDAKGFCNLRHQDAVGGAPGTEDKVEKGYNEDQPRDERGRWEGGGGMPVHQGTEKLDPMSGASVTMRSFKGPEDGLLHRDLWVDRNQTARAVVPKGSSGAVGFVKQEDGQHLTYDHEGRRIGSASSAESARFSIVNRWNDHLGKIANPYRAIFEESERIAKDFSLSAPLSTGLVPYDLAGSRPSPGSVCGICGEPLNADGLCTHHAEEDKVFVVGEDKEGELPAEANKLLAAIDAELARRGVRLNGQ